MKVEVKNLEKALELFENIIDMHNIAGNSDSPYTVNELFNYDYKTAESGVSLLKGILMGLDINLDGQEGTSIDPNFMKYEWEDHEEEEDWDDDNNMYTPK